MRSIRRRFSCVAAGKNTTTTTVSSGSHGALLDYLKQRHLVFQGKQLHSRLISLSLASDTHYAVKLIGLYGKSEHISDARKVFDRIPEKNLSSYNAMLMTYSLNNMHFDALNFYSSLLLPSVKPDHYTLTCLLKSLSRSLIHDAKLGNQVHAFALMHELERDTFVENSLISYYSKCGDLSLARKVFDNMKTKHIGSWNSMICGFVQEACFEDCKSLFREMMESSGLKPDVISIVSVLQACWNTNDLEFGTEVHHLIVDYKLEMSIFIYNALIGMYSRCGKLEIARKLFNEMPKRDHVSYASVIHGYMIHGQVEEARSIFGSMESYNVGIWNTMISGYMYNEMHDDVLCMFRLMQLSGFKPNPVTITSLLGIFSSLARLKASKEVHGYVIRNNYSKNQFVLCALIDSYAKSGFLHGAEVLFRQSRSRSLVVWTGMISAFATHGDAGSVLKLFDEMSQRGIKPDTVTLVSVLGACGQAGFLKKALVIFNSMHERYGVKPGLEHYACLVNGLALSGHLEEAKEFILKMEIAPSGKVWGALLKGACLWGKIEIGELACRHLFEIEPENAENYIALANLFSQAGRWKEADMVRKMMNRIRLKKDAGSSSVKDGDGGQMIATESSSRSDVDLNNLVDGLVALIQRKKNTDAHC